MLKYFNFAVKTMILRLFLKVHARLLLLSFTHLLKLIVYFRHIVEEGEGVMVSVALVEDMGAGEAMEQAVTASLIKATRTAVVMEALAVGEADGAADGEVDGAVAFGLPMVQVPLDTGARAVLEICSTTLTLLTLK